MDDQVIEKVKPGLYKLTDMPIISEQSMIDINMAMPRSVICLHSALSYYELTTTVPSVIMVALTRGNKPVKILYPPIKVFYFSHNNFVIGIEEKNTEYGTFRIYDVEKTIVDCFRYRKRLGEDIALEGLKNYLSKPNFKMNKILDYAKEGRMYNVIKPYIEAFIS
jgi:predicted transcriptional regulator of viral defense system